MKVSKRKALEKKGWKVGATQEFLNLSDEEAAYIEFKIALSSKFRNLRKKRQFTQIQIAEIIETSQSRVAKMEAGDPSVSIDLLIKALLALGATSKDIGKTIATSTRDAA